MSNESANEVDELHSPKNSEPLVTEEGASPELSNVEVLSLDDEQMNELSQGQPNRKKSWLPWKRPNRRDQQLSHLREGYIELLGLVRSISHHLDREKDEESQVTTLVESLPPALQSFEKLATSQKEVTAILGNLSSHMEKTSAKDDELLKNMQGFNSVLKDVSSSNEKSLGTLHQVSERIEHSDEQMKAIFEQANQSNQAAGALMVRLEKRVFLSNLALVALLCLLLLVGMFWVTKKQAPVAPTVITLPATQTVVSNPPVAEAPVVEASPVAVEEAGQPLKPATVSEAKAAPFPSMTEEADAPEAQEPSESPSNGLLQPMLEEEEVPSEETSEEEMIETLDLFDFDPNY